MPSTTTYSRGDIVLVPFPFTDLTSLKKRRALVVSPDSFNSIHQDVVLLAVTSQLADDPQSILLRGGDFVGGRLPKDSMLKTSKVFTVHSALVVKKLCSVKAEKLEEVLVALRRFYSSETVAARSQQIEMLREGDLVAEVAVKSTGERNWHLYLSVTDIQKLKDVRDALRRGDVESASKQARLFQLTPISK